MHLSHFVCYAEVCVESCCSHSEATCCTPCYDGRLAAVQRLLDHVCLTQPVCQEEKRKSLLLAILAATTVKTVISRVVYTVARGDRQCVE